MWEDEDLSIFDIPGIEIKLYTPPPVSQAEMYFNMYYMPRIMSYLNDPADYCYPYSGGTGIAIDCSHLMREITGWGSVMAKDRYKDFSGNKGKLFVKGELAVDLVVGMEVFKPSKRGDDWVENGHVGMLIKYDFGDGEGEVWAVFQSASREVTKARALYPSGKDPDYGPNITKFYNEDSSCGWKNYIDPWYYSDPLYSGGR